MTPEEKALIERAIEACGRGPAHAAERILLFPKLVELVTTTTRREAIYRREHRVELRRRMAKVRELVWKSKTSVESTPAGSEDLMELVRALTDLMQYLQQLEDTL